MKWRTLSPRLPGSVCKYGFVGNFYVFTLVLLNLLFLFCRWKEMGSVTRKRRWVKDDVLPAGNTFHGWRMKGDAGIRCARSETNIRQSSRNTHCSLPSVISLAWRHFRWFMSPENVSGVKLENNCTAVLRWKKIFLLFGFQDPIYTLVLFMQRHLFKKKKKSHLRA